MAGCSSRRSSRGRSRPRPSGGRPAALVAVLLLLYPGLRRALPPVLERRALGGRVRVLVARRRPRLLAADDAAAFALLGAGLVAARAHSTEQPGTARFGLAAALSRGALAGADRDGARRSSAPRSCSRALGGPQRLEIRRLHGRPRHNIAIPFFRAFRRSASSRPRTGLRHVSSRRTVEQHSSPRSRTARTASTWTRSSPPEAVA